jgi:hypothetical protein
MYWADYRDGAKKAKVHVGFDLNHGIPKKLFLTDGKGDERPFVGKILSPGETAVMDRYYQRHKSFDEWLAEGKHFICRIKASTKRQEIRKNYIKPDGIVFYDAVVILGTPGVNQTERPVRLIGYRVENTDYWVATDRYDLSAEQIAFAYKLRWNYRDILRLVETASEGLPPYFKEQIRTYGPDAGRIDYLHPLGHLLPR